MTNDLPPIKRQKKLNDYELLESLIEDSKGIVAMNKVEIFVKISNFKYNHIPKEFFQSLISQKREFYIYEKHLIIKRTS